MTEKELRELDVWIAGHVLGRKRGWHSVARHSTDPAAAMAVLKKCASRGRVTIGTYGGKWSISQDPIPGPCETETLELAICLFAKRVFGKKPQ